MKNKLCVAVAAYYFNDISFLYELNKHYPVHICAHIDETNDHKFIDIGLPFTVLCNIGLEFHCYDNYLMNVWDEKSDVLFLHDDLNFLPVLKNNEIISPMTAIHKIANLTERFDQCYIFQDQNDAQWNAWKHGRIFIMSAKLCKWFKDRMGFKYDTKMNSRWHTIPGVAKYNYNQGIEWFDEDLDKARKENFNVKGIALCQSIETLRRGMSHRDFMYEYGHYYKH